MSRTRDKASSIQDGEVFRNRLSRKRELGRELGRRQLATSEHQIEHLAPGRVRDSLEELFLVHTRGT